MGYQPSIRHKITLGYYGIAGVIVILVLFAFIELQFLEQRILFGERIQEFFDGILEVRRYEKNYLLYRQHLDYEASLDHLSRVRFLVEAHAVDFEDLVAPQRIRAISADLERYRQLMEEYGTATAPERSRQAALEGEIREVGKRITTIAEAISHAERRLLQASLNRSMTLVLFSIIALSVFGIVAGRVLSRLVVRPLKVMEDSMEVITAGHFKELRIDSRDREIVSLTRAFNNMLRELELRQRQMLQSEKLAALGTLLSGVAHELNNPLSNISSSCQILLEEIGEADADYLRELLGQIDEQTVRAQRIVRSLLDFSRDRDFRSQPLVLRELLRETIRFVRGLIPARVSVSTDVPADIAIAGDKQRLQQAFLNLIKNALEAVGEEGQVIIRARRRDLAQEGPSGRSAFGSARGDCPVRRAAVDIEITDTGPGIPADIQPKIFDPFFTTKDVGRGSGLGLFIVHEIIDEHDGCIAVQSEPGSGTTFTVRLPGPAAEPGVT
jgi:two-component system, NtrC family, sensor kinase